MIRLLVVALLAVALNSSVASAEEALQCPARTPSVSVPRKPVIVGEFCVRMLSLHRRGDACGVGSFRGRKFEWFMVDGNTVVLSIGLSERERNAFESPLWVIPSGAIFEAYPEELVLPHPPPSVEMVEGELARIAGSARVRVVFEEGR